MLRCSTLVLLQVLISLRLVLLLFHFLLFKQSTKPDFFLNYGFIAPIYIRRHFWKHLHRHANLRRRAKWWSQKENSSLVRSRWRVHAKLRSRSHFKALSVQMVRPSTERIDGSSSKKSMVLSWTEVEPSTVKETQLGEPMTATRLSSARNFPSYVLYVFNSLLRFLNYYQRF